MQPTKEQQREFWEKLGFRHFVEIKYARGVDKWEYTKPYPVKINRSYLPDTDINSL